MSAAQGSLWPHDGFELHESEAPQVREETAGAPALSDAELLALVIGGPPTRAIARARRLLVDAGTLTGVAALAKDGRIQTLSRVKVTQLRAVMEIARRISASAVAHIARQPLSRPELVAELLRFEAATLEVEKFWVLCLDRKNKLIRRVEISSGTATSALAHPREIFRAAMLASATAIICVHNHPSGDPAGHGFFSFREAGML